MPFERSQMGSRLRQVMRFIISGVMPNAEGEEDLVLQCNRCLLAQVISTTTFAATFEPESRFQTRLLSAVPSQKTQEPPVMHHWGTIFTFFVVLSVQKDGERSLDPVAFFGTSASAAFA